SGGNRTSSHRCVCAAVLSGARESTPGGSVAWSAWFGGCEPEDERSRVARQFGSCRVGSATPGGSGTRPTRPCGRRAASERSGPSRPTRPCWDGTAVASGGRFGRLREPRARETACIGRPACGLERVGAAETAFGGRGVAGSWHGRCGHPLAHRSAAAGSGSAGVDGAYSGAATASCGFRWGATVVRTLRVYHHSANERQQLRYRAWACVHGSRDSERSRAGGCHWTGGLGRPLGAWAFSRRWVARRTVVVR